MLVDKHPPFSLPATSACLPAFLSSGPPRQAAKRTHGAEGGEPGQRHSTPITVDQSALRGRRKDAIICVH